MTDNNRTAKNPGGCECAARFDKYGNPVDGSRIINCCFPDCGCDGVRLCMAERGASSCAVALNLEIRSMK